MFYGHKAYMIHHSPQLAPFPLQPFKNAAVIVLVDVKDGNTAVIGYDSLCVAHVVDDPSFRERLLSAYIRQIRTMTRPSIYIRFSKYREYGSLN
jgi:hypothetical protein